MKDFLTYLIKNIITPNKTFDIEESEADYALTFIIHVDQEEIGKIIGKKGKTIFAIRSLCNLYNHRNDPDSTKRVYINVAEVAAN